MLKSNLGWSQLRLVNPESSSKVTLGSGATALGSVNANPFPSNLISRVRIALK